MPFICYFPRLVSHKGPGDGSSHRFSVCLYAHGGPSQPSVRVYQRPTRILPVQEGTLSWQSCMLASRFDSFHWFWLNASQGHKLLMEPANYSEIESNMIWLGVAGLLDPPRPEVQDAIANCSLAGIRVRPLVLATAPIKSFFFPLTQFS